MKILSQNVNYFLGFNGKVLDYILKSSRGIIGNSRAEKANMEQFAVLVAEENPDMVFLSEVDKGSFRSGTDGQVSELRTILKERGIDYRSDIETKYGDKIYSSLPILRKMSNAVLYKEGFELEKHYLSPGSKQLVYELRKDDLSVFGVHLPLIKNYRQKQLDKLAEIVQQRDKTIVTGDFNNYYGKTELQEFVERTDSEIISPGETLHNSFLPYRKLDLFVSSVEEKQQSKVCDLTISDHLPIVFEIL